ncbi:hypothetical protein [Neptuniibacter halophilus]|nr:hypothetical protein [Neptuniibacter halophilus]
MNEVENNVEVIGVVPSILMVVAGLAIAITPMLVQLALLLG